jgi:hypothetical protein
VNSTFGRPRQNKANLPARPPRGAGWANHQRSRRCGVRRQTNPICAEAISRVNYSRAGCPCYGTPCAVPTDRTSAPNKPNLGKSHFEDKCCAEKDLQCIGREGSPHKTKPIARGGAPRRCLYCGLQIGDGAASGRLPAPCSRWPAWTGRTNKPNFRHCADPEIGGPTGRLRETNPILRLRIWDCGLRTDLRWDAYSGPCRLGPARAIVQNEANLRPSGRPEVVVVGQILHFVQHDKGGEALHKTQAHPPIARHRGGVDVP